MKNLLALRRSSAGSRVLVEVEIQPNGHGFKEYRLMAAGQVLGVSSSLRFQIMVRLGLPLSLVGVTHDGESLPVTSSIRVLTPGPLTSLVPLTRSRPSRVSSTDERVRALVGEYGIVLRPRSGVAVIEDVTARLPFARRSAWVAGVHSSLPDLEAHLVGATGANPKRFKLESRAVRVDHSVLQEAWAKALGFADGQEEHAAYLRFLQGMYAPQALDFARELTISCDSGYVLGRMPGSSNGLAGASTLGPWEWANLAYAASLGQGWDGGDASCVAHPLVLAQPALTFGEFEYFSPAEPYQRFVYVELLLESEEQLEALLALPVDVLAEVENPDNDSGEVLVKLLLRLSGTADELRRLWNSIPGKKEVVTGARDGNPDYLRDVHRATLPASPLSLPIRHTFVPFWRRMLAIFSASTDALVASKGADVVLGRSTSQKPRLVTLSSAKSSSLLLIGTPGTGKTTQAHVLASRGPFLTVHLSPPDESWTLDLAGKLAGAALRFKDIEPDGPEAFLERVSALKDEVVTEAEAILSESRPGRLARFPRVIRWEEGSQFLYFEYLAFVLEEFLDRIGKYCQKEGIPLTVILDDILATLVTSKDAKIGELSVNASVHLREAIKKAVLICRKYHILMIMTAQSLSGVVEVFGRGFFDAIPTAVVFSAEQGVVHKTASLFVPKNTTPDALAKLEEAQSAAEGEGSPKVDRRSVAGYRGDFSCNLPPPVLEFLLDQK